MLKLSISCGDLIKNSYFVDITERGIVGERLKHRG
jgi:hypothetical protein